MFTLADNIKEIDIFICTKWCIFAFCTNYVPANLLDAHEH